MAVCGDAPRFGLIPVSMIMARCKKDKWQQTLAVIAGELNRALTFGFLPSEVDAAKRELLKQVEMQADHEKDIENPHLLQNLVTCINNNRVYQSGQQTLEMFRSILAHVATEDLSKAFEDMWAPANRVIALTGHPVLGEKRQDSVAQAIILSVYWEAMDVSPSPPSPMADIRFPYLRPPDTAGRLVSRTSRSIPETGLELHEAVFSNGLVLRMVPTPFQAGRMSLALYLGQGLDGLGDRDYVAARLGMAQDRLSGFGRLTSEEANRLHNETGVSCFGDIGPHAAWITGRGEAREIDTLMDAMWSQFKDPYFTETERRLFIDNLAVKEVEDSKTVGGVFSQERMPFFHGEGLRTRRLTIFQARKVSLDQCRSAVSRAYRGGVPVFIAVGDFKPHSLVKKVGEYFGSSSVIYSEDMGADHGQASRFPPAENRNREIDVPAALNQARLMLAYFRPVDTVEDRRTIAMRKLTAGVIQNRLRKKIREDLGLAYSPSMSYYHDPDTGFGYYNISIGTQPDRLETLKNAVAGVLENAQRAPVTRDELDRRRMPMVEGWKNRRDTNGFYMGTLGRMARSPHPYLKWSAGTKKRLASIRPEEINQEIAEGFKAGNLASFSVTESRHQGEK